MEVEGKGKGGGVGRIVGGGGGGGVTLNPLPLNKSLKSVESPRVRI